MTTAQDSVAGRAARAVAETIRDDKTKLVDDIYFLANWQADAVRVNETIVERITAGLTSIIATEYAEVMEVLREIAASGQHRVGCRFVWTTQPCDCWVSRARELVGE